MPPAVRVVVAPDSFKESLTAARVCEALAAGVRRAVPDAEVVAVPMADGGEGTTDALVAATGGRLVTHRVVDALGRPVAGALGLLGDGRTAVVELAAAAGLEQVDPADRDPLRSTTEGVGALMVRALDAGVDRLLLGIGGSATNDGGAGLLAALGARLLDEAGTPLRPDVEGLERVAQVDLSGLDPRLGSVDLQVACDVDNPLLGDRGASAVFGPQKGLTPAQVRRCDAALAHWADVLEAACPVADRERPGAGAAGGAGFALQALGATLRPGIELVADAAGLAGLLEGADLVFTGEGRVDAQTLGGKTPAGVLALARDAGVPGVVIGGSVGPGSEQLLERGACAVLSLSPGPAELSELVEHAAEHLERTAQQAMGLWLAGRAARR